MGEFHVVGGTVRELVSYDINRRCYAVQYDVLTSNQRQYSFLKRIRERDFFKNGVRERCRKTAFRVMKKKMVALGVDYGAPPVPVWFTKGMGGILNMETANG